MRICFLDFCIWGLLEGDSQRIFLVVGHVQVEVFLLVEYSMQFTSNMVPSERQATFH